MFRVLLLLSAFALLLWSCGPDKPRTCSGDAPTFRVLLKLTSRPLPADTVVHVTYAGSAKEAFRLSNPKARLDVTFCELANEDGSKLEASAPMATGSDGSAGAAGAGGAAPEESAGNGIPALVCKLFTGGFTELEVSGSGFTTVGYKLSPDKERCTVEKPLLLDAPDAGSTDS